MTRPIIPKRDPFAEAKKNAERVVLLLTAFLFEAKGRLKNYPRAVSSSYVRTGELGKKWTVSPPQQRGRSITGRVGNVQPYAIWVQGPTKGPGKKQRRLFQRRGWLSITQVRKELWDQNYKRRILRALQGKRLA